MKKKQTKGGSIVAKKVGLESGGSTVTKNGVSTVAPPGGSIVGCDHRYTLKFPNILHLVKKNGNEIPEYKPAKSSVTSIWSRLRRPKNIV